MEYIKHGDLGAYIQTTTPIPITEAKEITKQILEGLEVLHGKFIYHRDLKPEVLALLEFPLMFSNKILVEYSNGFSRSNLDQNCRLWNIETSETHNATN